MADSLESADEDIGLKLQVLPYFASAAVKPSSKLYKCSNRIWSGMHVLQPSLERLGCECRCTTRGPQQSAATGSVVRRIWIKQAPGPACWLSPEAMCRCSGDKGAPSGHVKEYQKVFLKLPDAYPMSSGYQNSLQAERLQTHQRAQHRVIVVHNLDSVLLISGLPIVATMNSGLTHVAAVDGLCSAGGATAC